MALNLINSKIFFGTESKQESEQLFNFLQQSNIRCQMEALTGKDAAKRFKDDPFHFYAKSYLEKLVNFYVIRVHRLDFDKAFDLYNIDY